MNLKNLIHSKNILLFNLEAEKKIGNTRKVFELGSEVASLEGNIARIYKTNGQIEKSVINLISQASCLLDSKRYLEARRVYQKAFHETRNSSTKDWLNESISKISQNFHLPFLNEKVNIEGNTFLRKPQIESYLAAKEHFSNSNSHAIIQLPVGCGKTGAMSVMPFNLSEGRVLAIAPNLEIRRNLYKNFNYFGPDSFLKKYQVLHNGNGPRCAYLDNEANILDCDNSDIVVTNIQQLASRGSKKWLKMLSPDFFDMILIDEAHHNVAPSWQKSLNNFPDSKLLSFTATPLRSDGKKVEGDRIYRFPIITAIKDGYIKDIASRRLEPENIYFTYKDEKRKASLEEILSLREEKWFSRGVALSRECNESIVDASIQSLNDLKENGGKQQIIAVACSIDHAKSIRSLYEERGYKSEVIHSKMDDDDQESVLLSLKQNKINAIIQVQMLGEGADYPNLSVAAIFRPFRHLMPYVQFVGRIMRVIKQNSPGDPVNRGFVVSHIGLNVDKWWDELRSFDQDDEEFFNEMAIGEHDFILNNGNDELKQTRMKFRPSMDVIEEALVHFVEEHFVPEDAKILVDDLINAMNERGIDFEALGLTRSDLEKKLIETNEKKKQGKLQKLKVSPQEARKAARRRLDERVRSAAKQLLNELKYSIGGFDIPRKFPSSGASNNLAAAIILLNKEVRVFLNVGSNERDILSNEQLREAHDNMDKIIDSLAEKIKKSSK
jgi:DNA repair protein RadD